MICWIIIALYWIVSCVVIYAKRNKIGKNPLNRPLKLETKLSEHLLIILSAPIGLPIILLLEKGGDDLSYNEDNIDEGNIFASKAKYYIWQINHHLSTLEKKDADAAFWNLDSLSLEEGYHLGLRVAGECGKGDVSNFYVYDNNGEKDKDLLKYIRADETPMGAWQVYLLMTSPTLLPTYWRGGYIVRKFILKEQDLYKTGQPHHYGALCNLAKKESLYPSVEFEDNSDIKTAQIHCCYWNDWEGLVREHVEIQMQNGKVISYEEKDSFVLYKFHCGYFL